VTDSSDGYSVAELMVAAFAAEIVDGELLTQGIGTHLPTCAYFLAKRTHAPSCALVYSVGGTVSNRGGRIGLTSIERLALDRPLRRVSYTELVCDTLPGLGFKEFSRPAQVDGFGNTNNMAIGPYERPKIRLPGAGGIPDFSPYETHDSLLYVPRHDRRALVRELDFRSGVDARRLVTDLAIVDFRDEGAVLASVHPGVEVEDVIAATGFDLHVPSEVERTPAPTPEQLEIIREIDPLAIRDLEFVPAGRRIDRIREIQAAETVAGAVG
jgi:glutaconate CoA-transferase subunit B